MWYKGKQEITANNEIKVKKMAVETLFYNLKIQRALVFSFVFLFSQARELAVLEVKVGKERNEQLLKG